MRFVTKKRFDISGGEVLRIGKHFIISKFAKHEDFCGGPGLKYLIAAFMGHYFGRFLAWLITRYEKLSWLLLKFLKQG